MSSAVTAVESSFAAVLSQEFSDFFRSGVQWRSATCFFRVHISSAVNQELNHVNLLCDDRKVEWHASYFIWAVQIHPIVQVVFHGFDVAFLDGGSDIALWLAAADQKKNG